MSNGNGASQETQAAVEATRYAELVRILEAHRGERHAVVIQDFPDPDAISCAFTHQLISANFDITVDILYVGRLSHQQNIALVKLLGISLVRYEKNMTLPHYHGAVFVDNQGTTAEALVEVLEAAHVPILIVVDHHEGQKRLEPAFSDCRRTGATATIYTDYLEHGLLELDKARREHVVAATALMHGIMTDTGNFIRAGAADFHAARFLSQFRDADVLEQIMSQSRSKQVMEIIRRALGNRVIVENISLAGIGYLRAEDRDAIPQAADFLLTEENVHTAIVYGIMLGDDKEETLIGSMRTSKLTTDTDDFIKEVFGRDAAGRYFGGGKLSAGGFNIPIEFLAGMHSDEYRELKWQVYDSQIKQKVFAKVGVEHNMRERVNRTQSQINLFPHPPSDVNFMPHLKTGE
ncbi:MAG TPA: bifunctional oligoribonuclease/PAP phosphatase NrnA [Anaerolineae bacterium]|nr:bifunctional oligoribonuclease/PAP phosphatase NrnA [Anaerolineae bacterium]